MIVRPAAFAATLAVAALAPTALAQSGEFQLWRYDQVGAQLLFGGGQSTAGERTFAQSGTLTPGLYGLSLGVSRQVSLPAAQLGWSRLDSISSWELRLDGPARTFDGSLPYENITASATGSAPRQTIAHTPDFAQRFTESGSITSPSSAAFSSQLTSHFGGTLATADARIHLAAGSRAGAASASSTATELSWLFQVDATTNYALTGQTSNSAAAGTATTAGSSQFTPTTPSGTVGGAWRFTGVTSGQYFDPAVAFGFRYAMTGAAKFTQVQDFPVGFSDAFTVSTGDQVLGTFAPGQKVDFVSLTGGGVSSFTVSGITPRADADPAVGFPLQLAFDAPSAEFLASALVPAPGDANFDARVDFTDLARLAQSYNTGVAGAWDTGDFNGDGSVDFNDLVILAQNYSGSATSASSFEADLAAAFASVPEPTGLALIGVATAAFTRRRRR